ncbi:RNA polymerase sigma-70 factor (ECF subfamily) [Filimonas zeae]|uniref:DNA-directed RNA polymerase sigma-70 factor n=1 Tax=Filimonas zeae TaxID=1737353 RepID=A0A917ISH9_9BACT|nr:sigma-70 family RNA polymerase sigma factor [Filimonas zeae]MDR6338031.1 RNA polymerase sigma-70 factor (ECF subfamily) [Filimonas zeae]GGH61384.1 DNA-directed RNA polymerase sigma-70 factor [Filimonas zeae]
MRDNTVIYDEVVVMQRFREGNEEAFTLIYKQLYQRVYLYARKYLEAMEDAGDVTAESFLQLLQGNRNFTSLDGVAAFLHVTVRNRCINLLKHRQMKNNHHAAILKTLEEEDPADLLEDKIRVELLHKIYAEVDKLPERMREIFLLSYLEGLKPAQIAERLQIKPQTVINQRVTALKLLQQMLTGEQLLLLLLLIKK